MIDHLPTVTFLIPVPPGASPIEALAALDGLDYPADRIEIIVIEGTNPSRQRNAGAAAAKGELLYYVDNDSLLDPHAIHGALECLIAHPRAAEIAGVGGPVLTSSTDTPFQQAAGAALGSLFGLGPFRSRYAPRGLPRETDESELISANLIVRREIVIAGEGFDERLYPNEENELLNRLSARGVLLYHHPGMLCRRSQRRDLAAVLRQHVRYGRGRARHIAIDRRGFRPLLLLPIGLLAAIVMALSTRGVTMALPLFVYAVTAIVSAGALAASLKRRARAFITLLAIFPTMHVGYALGLLWGLAERLSKGGARLGAAGGAEISVRVVKPLGAAKPSE